MTNPVKTKFEVEFENYINTPVKSNDDYILKHKDHLKDFYALEESILKHGAKIGFELGSEYEKKRAEKLVEALKEAGEHHQGYLSKIGNLIRDTIKCYEAGE